MANGGSVVIQAILDDAKLRAGISEIEAKLKGISTSGLDDIDAAAQQAGAGLDEAAQDAEDLGGSLGGLSDALEGLTGGAGGLGGVFDGLAGAAGKINPAAVGIGAVATATVAIGTAASGVATEYQNAAGLIQASLGTTAEESARLRDVAAEIYTNGFGASLNDVATTLSTVKGRIRDLSDSDLQYVTQAAQVMADTFGVDVGESVRGVNALMEGFGISATEATDLLAAGMQNGLNFSGELADNLAEYSGRWGEAGVSASEYFSLLQAGADNGAYSLDKVGDFLNEFLTSLSDGRMDEAIGQMSDGTQEVFENFKNGKADAQDVLNAVIGDMQQMTSDTDRAALASQLWSSLGEDNAMGMITALGGVEDSYGDVAGAAEGMADSMSQSIDSKATQALRNLQELLVPVGNAINSVIGMALDGFNSLFGSGSPVAGAGQIFQGAMDAIAPFAEYIQGNFQGALDTLSAGFGGVLSAVEQAAPLFQFLGTVIGGVLVVAVGLLSELVSNLAMSFSGMLTTIQGVITFISGFFNLIVGLITGNGEMVNGAVSTMLNGVLTIVTGILNTILGIFGLDLNQVVSFFSGAFSTAQSVVSSVMGGISSTISGIMGGVSSTVNSIVSGIKGFFTSGFNAAYSTVTGIFNNIKSAISNAMNTAKDTVRGIVNSIKGFFNFSVSWPHIPLPHFSISPAGWQVGDLLKGSIPSLGINWYAKGGVFDGASVIGVGEAGAEAAVPLTGSRMRPFAQAIGGEIKGIDEMVYEIRMLRRELPELFKAYCLRVLEVNDREFARLVKDTEGLV